VLDKLKACRWTLSRDLSQRKRSWRRNSLAYRSMALWMHRSIGNGPNRSID
jgi:hypothetical protein